MNDPMDSSALKCTHYMGEEWEGVEMPLLVDEKVDILSSWEFMNAIMGAGDKDPTSQTGGFM
jgi:hypothetical protein